MADRNQILHSMFNVAGLGLEIGASYNPLVSKSSGARIETIDYIDQAGLLAKYAADPSVDTSRIEEVDYIANGQRITNVIPHRKRYDFIIASHVIEHMPDPIAFFNDCAMLLKDDGRLVMAIPDKRTCFDAAQAITTAGQLLDANLAARERPTPGAIFDAMAYDTLLDGQIGWSISDRGSITFANELNLAGDLFHYAQTAHEYIDVHQWRFTPSSFRLLVSDLHAIGSISIGEVAFHGTFRNEFFVALAANDVASGDRIRLVKEALREQAVGALTFHIL